MSTKRWHEMQVQELNDRSRKNSIATSYHSESLKSEILEIVAKQFLDLYLVFVMDQLTLNYEM